MAITEMMTSLFPMRRRQAQADRSAWQPVGEDCWLFHGVVLLVPTEHCRLIPVSLPARRSRDIEAALPFVLEDHLAQDLEQVRYAWRRDADGITVLVCERECLRGWVAALPAGIPADRVRVLPDILSLPLEADCWSLCLRGERLLVRTGQCSGFACDLPAAPALLQALCRQSATPDGVLVVAGEGLSDLDVILKLLRQEFDLSTQTREIQWPAQIDTRSAWLRLTDTPVRVAPRRLWLLALLLVVVGAALQAGLMWWRGTQLAAHHEALQAQTLALFREAFPDVRRVVNPRIQARQRLHTLRERAQSRPSEGELLSLMLVIGKAMQERMDTRIQRFRYHDGGLEIYLLAPDITMVDSLQAALVKRGLRAELVSARIPERGGDLAGGHYTLARLRVRP